ncbi:MAG: DUF429 domain-containing protein [Planctomycetes bacterium]|nr:DUF429 domain-containing protein [Planctomycetota bacterium]
MRTLGIDLASAAAKTAFCTLAWQDGAARIEHLELGADDDRLTEAAGAADHVGVDAPCGWPRAFVRMLQQPPRAMRWPDERDALRFRATDHFVRRVTGRWPLSVSSDLIGVVAMRCRGLLARFAEVGRTCLEVYPAAALHQWGIAARGYKGKRREEALGERVDAVLGRASWLVADDAQRAQLRSSDDAFDALVASLAVRAFATGRVSQEHACPDDPDVASEGWIVLPAAGSLERLAG